FLQFPFVYYLMSLYLSSFIICTFGICKCQSYTTILLFPYTTLFRSNDEIDKLRHSATSALFERRDVLIVASVSCIYGLGSPEEYESQVLSIRMGMEKERNQLLRDLVDIQYARNDIDFKR